jgi:hypothetical protein
VRLQQECWRKAPLARRRESVVIDFAIHHLALLVDGKRNCTGNCTLGLKSEALAALLRGQSV